MKWIYDADGNADLEEVAFAEKGRTSTSLRRQVALRTQRCAS